MASREGWSALFTVAFRQSRNPMALLDDKRRHVEVNGAYLNLLGHSASEVIGQPFYRFVADGPLLTPKQWEAALRGGDFTGRADLVTTGGSRVAVQWGAHPETVTGHRLLLLVALSTSRWGGRLRPPLEPGPETGLSDREREVVRLVAQGHSGPEIADELRISHDTARTHVRNAMTKLRARSRAHLVAKAIGEGHVLD